MNRKLFLNSKKIDLAIEKNEVEELIEKVVNLRIKNKDIEVAKNKSVLDISSALVKSSSLTRKEKTKDKQRKKKELTPEDIARITQHITLLNPLQGYAKSVENFGLRSYYDINQHPDFENLKKVSDANSKRRAANETGGRMTRKGTIITSSSVDRGNATSSLLRRKTLMSQMTIQEDFDEDFVKEAFLISESDIDFEYITQGNFLSKVVFIKQSYSLQS